MTPVDALRALVTKLDLINDDPNYRSIWFDLVSRGRPFAGPNCEVELQNARAALVLADSDPADSLAKGN